MTKRSGSGAEGVFWAKGINRRQFLVGAGVAAGAAALSLSGCGVLSGKASDKGPIKIGYLQPRSGVFANLGEASILGGQLAADEINAAGGIGGRKLELMIEDDGNNPGVGSQKARKLIEQDKVHALVGVVSSAVALAVMEVAAANKVPFVCSSANGSEITGSKCSPYTFRVDSLNRNNTHTLVPYMTRNVGKKMYIVAADYAWGQDGARLAEAAAKDAGAQVTGKDMVPLGTNDWSAYILKIKQNQPDWVFLSIGGTDMHNFLKQWKEFGLRGGKTQLGGICHGIEDAWTVGPDVYTGYWVTLWFHGLAATKPDAKSFVDKFAKKYPGKDPASTMGWQDYISVLSMAKAFEKAGGTDPTKFVKALETVKLPSYKGKDEVYYRDWDHQLIQNVFIVKAKDKWGDKYDAMELVAEYPNNEIKPDYFNGKKEEMGCNMPAL